MCAHFENMRSLYMQFVIHAQVMGLSGGMLHTHDEETHQYFQGTNVSVGKSLRCAAYMQTCTLHSNLWFASHDALIYAKTMHVCMSAGERTSRRTF